MEVGRAPLLRVLLVAAASAAVLVALGRQPAQPSHLSAWSPGRPAALVGSSEPAGAPAGGVMSVPLSLAGDVGFNVRSALDARGGALRSVTIQPGETWSFNATVGDPAGVPIRTVGGVPGGGWCDLASRYVQAVRPILPRGAVAFVNHVTSSGIPIADVSDDDAVSIWNIDGRPGSAGERQDLQITNTLAVPLRLTVEVAGESLVVRASAG